MKLVRIWHLFSVFGYEVQISLELLTENSVNKYPNLKNAINTL